MILKTPQSAPTVLALVLITLIAACGDRGDDVVTGEPLRLESREVDIAVEVPPGASFVAAGTEGGVLRLQSSGETGSGGVELGPATVVYAAEPPQEAGVNLVEAVNGRAEEIRSRPEGQFFGQGELGGPLGVAYSTRGRYRGDDGAEVEEIRIFAVHPQQDRLLHMTLAYPPATGQTAARLDQALSAFGWIEPLEPGADEPGGSPPTTDP